MTLRLNAVVFVTLLSLLTHAASAQSKRPQMDAAVQAGNWIRSTQVDTPWGRAWPMDPENTRAIVRHLYSGTPGIILFFLELETVTGDPAWLEDARAGADELMSWLATEPEGNPAGLWTGLGGQAYVLHQVYEATNNAKYLAGAKHCIDRIKATAIEDDHGGVSWDESTDIVSGTAGVGLALLYAAREMGDDEALALAMKAGHGLLLLADDPAADNGGGGVAEVEDGEKPEPEYAGAERLRWRMTPTYARIMPNFSHGTAGVAYFLATLHDAVDAKATDTRFLDAAVAGARHLQAIAETRDDGRWLIMHHEPGGETLFYLGWCHGPIGTSALFLRLAQVTGDESWRGWVAGGADTLIEMGVPERRTAGFWENVGQCCGSAGMGAFFVDMHETMPDGVKYPSFARRIDADVMRRAETVELPDGETGLKWPQCEYRVRPEHVVAQTGHMQGASGIGMWLLRMDAYETRRVFTRHLPDSPFRFSK